MFMIESSSRLEDSSAAVPRQHVKPRWNQILSRVREAGAIECFCELRARGRRDRVLWRDLDDLPSGDGEHVLERLAREETQVADARQAHVHVVEASVQEVVDDRGVCEIGDAEEQMCP